jgi:hypothetical protein
LARLITISLIMKKVSFFAEISKSVTGFLIILLLVLACPMTAKGMAERGDTTIKAIAYTLPWDDMPIDLSSLYEKDKPAGKHGFLTVQGDRFVFEDGTEARFWGTNFNSAQNFPSHEHSVKVARRLAKIGVNMVRFHQLDAEWSTPNIFQFTKGSYKANTMNFDPVSMDRLDYLIHCLKQEGIYIYMDLLTYRRFKSGDGVEAAEQLGDAAKPYSTFNRRMIELQKKFAYDLWTHKNPYTDLAYKDDPAIVLVEVTNENDLFTQKVTLEPYRTELEQRYRDWAEGKGLSLDEARVDFMETDRSMLEFFIDVTKAYYGEMIQHMRATGVKIPITGTNWSRVAALLSCQLVTDYCDAHAYTSGGGWRDASGRFGNQPNVSSANNMLPVLTFNRAAGKPFIVSEWDNPWPNEWRAESALLMASAGSLQGWSGFVIHTYRYTLDENVDMIGKPITSLAIGGRVYRGGVFDAFNDPAKFGLFYHAALILRRGDVKPAEKTIAIKLDDLSAGPGLNALQLSPEQHRLEMVIPGVEARADMVVGPDKQLVDTDKGEVLSDTKQLYRNLKKKFGWIDTPNTKAVYGFTGKEGELELTNFSIDVKTDFATVALSTLEVEPIKHSKNMLLTAVGRADNTNSRYQDLGDGTMRQLDAGHGPIQVEIIEAAIEIETDIKNLRVMAINPQGIITGYLPSEYKDGVFRFEIGKEFQSMYYLIQDL